MIRGFRKRYIIIPAVVLSFALIGVVHAVTADPGSDSDPIVTKSYVDQKISEALKNSGTGSSTSQDSKINDLTLQIKALTQRISALEAKAPGTGSSDEGFQVVELSEGSKLLAGSGTEIIVRAGASIALQGEFGGLSNVTQGVDLKEGDKVPTNNLLISSRDDYRGIKANSKMWVLVRGSYTIK